MYLREFCNTKCFITMHENDICFHYYCLTSNNGSVLNNWTTSVFFWSVNIIFSCSLEWDSLRSSKLFGLCVLEKEEMKWDFITGNRFRILLVGMQRISETCVVLLQDAPEFWISRQDYLEEGVACLSKCGQPWILWQKLQKAVNPHWNGISIAIEEVDTPVWRLGKDSFCFLNDFIPMLNYKAVLYCYWIYYLYELVSCLWFVKNLGSYLVTFSNQNQTEIISPLIWVYVIPFYMFGLKL